MKLYYEAVETVLLDPTIGEFVPQDDGGEFARLDVTDYTKAEREQILAALKDFMPGCTYIEHICYHDEGLPCRSTVL